MSLLLSQYIGQVLQLRLVINGDYPEKESGQQYIVLDAGENSLFALRADAIEAKDFAFYVLPLCGDVHYEITGVADGRGVLLRLQSHLPNVLTVERIIGTTRSYQLAMVKYAVPLHRINQLLALSTESHDCDEEEEGEEIDTQMEPVIVERPWSERPFGLKVSQDCRIELTVPAETAEIIIRREPA